MQIPGRTERKSQSVLPAFKLTTAQNQIHAYDTFFIQLFSHLVLQHFSHLTIPLVPQLGTGGFFFAALRDSVDLFSEKFPILLKE